VNQQCDSSKEGSIILLFVVLKTQTHKDKQGTHTHRVATQQCKTNKIQLTGHTGTKGPIGLQDRK